ncbi:10 transmembrane domain, possible aa transporter, putative [Perkinsus marinus ATCC 50983]|uniref:10 transmembrane domain, possible aa transporter, putative n=1 Tax=Perkinsus marinus (strain ATCC 50983 / TXsc) TaxID=423536 RepID=C5KE99_PERM5|nr:10 transmembrane domain, possible aa transporter, putative [Perkinsus marinus ATCC 50983]EER17194.1 10 transmembrane domain, possible aa transporter, putative [Perkinsus marinus ATCC 50983]|eukprot:XP_002785398.1 10 transmembrane domain, possible aa transporter, putative [Perkinsus marinus ATCC 50983]
MSSDKVNRLADFHSAPVIPKGNVLTAWAVLTNSIIGAGMLSYASAQAVCGWVLGIVLLLIFGLLSYFSLHLISRCAMKMPGKRLSYSTFAVAAGYPRMPLFIDTLMFIHNAGIDTAYLQVFSSLGLALLENWAPGSTSENRFWIRVGLIALIIALLSPVCFLKQITNTTITNVIGLSCFLYAIVAGVAYSFSVDEQVGERYVGIPPTTTVWSILSVFPIFIFGYSCHFVMPLVAEDMVRRNMRKLDLAALLAVTSVVVVYLSVMVGPYYAFGDTIESNFYLNLPVSNVAIHIGYIALPFAVLTAFPLLLFPARQSISSVITYFLPNLQDTLKLHIGTTITFLVICTGLAIIFEDLGVTIQFIGIIGTNFLAFVIPCFVYLNICYNSMSNPSEQPVSEEVGGLNYSPDVKDDEQQEKVSLLKKLRNQTLEWHGALALFIISLIFFPLCLTGLLYELTTN